MACIVDVSKIFIVAFIERIIVDFVNIKYVFKNKK
jgi:hypothetical protein